VEQVFHWVVTLCRHDEISWNKFGTLVEKLEERVLSVGSWLSEENGASGVLDVVASAGDSLAVRLHGELL
jgi:hypothetical protein